jgi:hypothetical protein
VIALLGMMVIIVFLALISGCYYCHYPYRHYPGCCEPKPLELDWHRSAHFISLNWLFFRKKVLTNQ